jgi:hypothetical protein
MLFSHFTRRLSLALFVCSPLVCAPHGARADLLFSAEEISAHERAATTIARGAADCLDATYRDHLSFYRKHGISRYYGERKEEHQTEAGLIAELEKYGKDPAFVDSLLPTSCIGLTLKCLGVGFRKAGQTKTWNKLKAVVKANGVLGTDLIFQLRKLGWRTLYWNPNPAKNAAWDADDRARERAPKGKKANIVWGQHEALYSEVLTKKTYQKIPIDDASTLVDFGENPPASFLTTPFFVGIAHSGYHVFPGHEGKVVEAHSTRNLNSSHNLETSEFNPLAPGGGPRWTGKERYRSGVIAVPPGY